MKNYKIHFQNLLVVSILLTFLYSCNSDDELTSNVVNPKAEFTMVTSDVDPYLVEFTSKVTDRDSLRWDFGDGESATIAHPTHTYAETGEYIVTLTAFGEPGSSPYVAEKAVIITLNDPTAEFTSSASTDNPLELKFTANTTYGRSFEWDFGDGGGSTQQNPTHEYATAGSYMVTLTVTGFDGTTPATISKEVSAGTVLTKLEGTVIGHESSWNDNPDTYVTAALDGNLDTFVDGPTAEGYVGYDLGAGNEAVVTLVKYAPRKDYGYRMVGGEIRGSNDPDYLNNYDILYSINEAPATGVLTEVPLSGTGSYRYIYYYSSDGYGNITELEFYGSGSESFDSGLINMNDWTVQEATAGVTVNIAGNSINFSGAGAWAGSHIFQEVTVEAGTYILSGSITVNSVIDETWSELIFSTDQPQPGEDFAPGIPYQVSYSTWNGSPTEAGTYDLKDANKGGEYPENGLYSFDAPQTFYIVIKSGSNQPYDLTWNDLAFKKVD